MNRRKQLSLNLCEACIVVNSFAPGSANRGHANLSRFCLYAVCLLAWILLPASMHAQGGSQQPTRVYNDRALPPVTIPVQALGYRPPGVLPAFSFYSLVNLQYVDASHLLFTFNTMGLLERDNNCSSNDSERLVRAVILDVPSGKVEKQATWKLYDFMDFLLNLGGGQFILRNCSQLERVDSSLVPQPFITLGGSLEDLILSPDRSMVLVEEKPPAPTLKPQSGNAGSSVLSQQAASLLASHPEQRITLNFIRLHPLGIAARSHAPTAMYLPIVEGGVFEVLAAPKNRWDVTLQPLKGTTQHIVSIRSACPPQLTAITDSIFAANMCPKSDQTVYEGYNLQGALLWQIPLPPDLFLPRFILTKNGARFAIETIHATHPRAALDPIDPNGVDAEVIAVYDTLTGNRIASFATTPIYTAGTNVDFSPDGTHIAVLHNETIEIHDLHALANVQPALPH